MELDKKLKVALDESRLLILGAQVLFGFLFQSIFQELFRELPYSQRLLLCTSLVFILVTLAFLITPSMYHRIAFGGQSSRPSLRVATAFSSASMLTLSLGLGVSIYVVFGRILGAFAGLVVGCTVATLSLTLLFGVGLLLRTKDKGPPEAIEDGLTPLATKIAQLLTEARVIIPGGQALLGFQMIATLTRAFSDLSWSTQMVHLFGLCAVALAVILLMSPAAIHRVAYDGEDDPHFFRIGSRLVVASAVPLALGIAADIYVVFFTVTKLTVPSSIAGLACLSILMGLWFVYPLAQRARLARLLSC